MNLKSFKKEVPEEDTSSKIDFKKGDMKSTTQINSTSRLAGAPDIEINIQSATVKSRKDSPIGIERIRKKEKRELITCF